MTRFDGTVARRRRSAMRTWRSRLKSVTTCSHFSNRLAAEHKRRRACSLLRPQSLRRANTVRLSRGWRLRSARSSNRAASSSIATLVSATAWARCSTATPVAPVISIRSSAAPGLLVSTRCGREASPGSHSACQTRGTALPRHAIDSIRPEASADANFFEPRQTPTTLGLGLLERVPREVIEALADPADDDEDGISGRAHLLEDGRLGRFGWKANVPSIREFVRDALSGELGVTVPDESGFSFGSPADDDEATDPEADLGSIDAIASFIELLAPPPRTRADMTLEDLGEAIFDSVGCSELPRADVTDRRRRRCPRIHRPAFARRCGPQCAWNRRR